MELHFLFELPSDSLAVFHTHLNNLESISYEASLDLLIDSSICIERRSMVYFKHPWLQLLVEHDIEAE